VIARSSLASADCSGLPACILSRGGDSAEPSPDAGAMRAASSCSATVAAVEIGSSTVVCAAASGVGVDRAGMSSTGAAGVAAGGACASCGASCQPCCWASRAAASLALGTSVTALVLAFGARLRGAGLSLVAAFLVAAPSALAFPARDRFGPGGATGSSTGDTGTGACACADAARFARFWVTGSGRRGNDPSSASCWSASVRFASGSTAARGRVSTGVPEFRTPMACPAGGFVGRSGSFGLGCVFRVSTRYHPGGCYGSAGAALASL